jgi:5-methylcytosine-specific restriction endonuclease McrA
MYRNPADKKAYDRRYKQTHKDLYRRIRQRRRAKLKEHVRKLKDRPCADCGRRFPYYVMDFDHRPEHKKAFGVGRFVASVSVSSTKRVDAEIAKCDVVCSNCHRIRTHNRLDAKQMPKNKRATAKSLKLLHGPVAQPDRAAVS